MKSKDIAKYWSLAAVLMFAAAVFQIVSERFLLGAICFGAAACFMAAAGKYRKKGLEENGIKEEETGAYES